MQEIDIIVRRFSALNRDRLRRLLARVRSKQRPFLEALPLLFHVNHPQLPGFVSEHTPAGLPGYTVPKKVIDGMKTLFKDFKYKFRALPRYPIYGIYLTGSSSTVAYSEKSDFDIWVCHNPEIKDEDYSELLKKTHGIKTWARELGLKVHFFLVDEVSFKDRHHDELSTESSGTTQHHLLLEEFYRTGLYMAGRYPAWWVVPPDQENNYRDYLADITGKGIVSEFDFIDFGTYMDLTAEEFIGASLWQIYKGIDSPYKSVLKIMLMEAYASEYPDIDFLASRFKEAIYEGEKNINRLDPYALMCHKVEEYLLARNEPARLELIRRCFYFKVDEQLSTPAPRKKRIWQRELMQDLVLTWGWDDAHLLMLDSRHSWKIHRVLEERKTLVDELTHSYRLLTGFIGEHTRTSSASNRDLHVLGRKLHTAFDRRAGKIEIVNPDISPNLMEPNLSIHKQVNRDGREFWQLYRGKITVADKSRTTPLKRARSILELCGWCQFNNLIGASTAITLYTQNTNLDNNELKKIINELKLLYPGNFLGEVDLDTLSTPASYTSMSFFINVGIDPLARYSAEGKHIISEQNDALKFGNFHQNLAMTIDAITITSWNEVLTTSYEGTNGLMDCLCEFINMTLLQKHCPDIRVFSYSSLNSHIITRRLQRLLKNIFKTYNKSDHPTSSRYVLAIAKDYYLIHFLENAIQYRKFSTREILLEELSFTTGSFVNTVIDDEAFRGDVLPFIIRKNKPGIIQLYYKINKDMVDTYVVDETGAIFHQTAPYFQHKTLLNQYHRFLESVRDRINFLPLASHINRTEITGIEYYSITNDKKRTYRLTRRTQSMQESAMQYYSVQVITGYSGNDKDSISVFCDDWEFSMMELGEDLFIQVANRILMQRKMTRRYPIYITDIDLSQNSEYSEAMNFPSTVDYLKYKKAIELKLNEALEKQTRLSLASSI